MIWADELLLALQGPSLAHAFAYGCIASLAAEVALFTKAFGPRGAITDKKYTSKLYWSVRVFLAACAGFICTAAYSPTLNPFVYVYLGIAMPGLLHRGAEAGAGVADDENGQG